MKNGIRILCIILGGFLALDAILAAILTNFHFGLLLTLVVGIMCIILGIFLNPILQATQHGPLKWLKYLVICFMAAGAGLLLLIGIPGQNDTVTYKEDALIVLGASVHGETVSKVLAYRLDKAAEYLNSNPDAICIVSGGKGPQEAITEALAMERYLIEKGIPGQRIIKEEKATSTYENFLFSKALLDQHFDHPYTTAYITNGFHIYRAGQIADLLGMPSSHLHAKIDWYDAPMNYLRECAALLKFWILKN